MHTKASHDVAVNVDTACFGALKQSWTDPVSRYLQSVQVIGRRHGMIHGIMFVLPFFSTVLYTTQEQHQAPSSGDEVTVHDAVHVRKWSNPKP